MAQGGTILDQVWEDVQAPAPKPRRLIDTLWDEVQGPPGAVENFAARILKGISASTESGVTMAGRAVAHGMEALGIPPEQRQPMPSAEAGQRLLGTAGMRENPALAGSFLQAQVPEALGSTVGMGLQTVALGPLGAAAGLGPKAGAFAAGALSGAATNAGQAYEDILARTGDESKAWDSAYWNGLIGTSEAADVLVAFGASKALRPFIRGGLGQALAKIDTKLGGLLKEALFGAGVEAFQEGSQQFLQGYVDQKLTGQEHQLLSEALQAAQVGGAIGFIFGAGGTAVQGVAGERGPSQAEAEAAQRAERTGARTEPVERKPLALPPEIQSDVETFAEQARTAKPPEGEESKLPKPLAEAEGLRAVEPTTPAELLVSELGAKSGAPVTFVERTGGGRLPLAGRRTAAGILIDANAPSELQIKQVAFEELIHEVAGREPTAYQTLYEELGKLDPEGLALAEKNAREEHVAAGVPYPETSDLAKEEGVGLYAQRLAGYLDMRLSQPDKLAALFEAKPGFARKVLDWLRDLLSKLKLVKSSESQRLNKIARQIALTPFEARMDPTMARTAADAIASAYSKLGPRMEAAIPTEQAAAPTAETQPPSAQVATEPAQKVEVAAATTVEAPPAQPSLPRAARVERPSMPKPLTRRERANPLLREDVRRELEGMAMEAGMAERGGQLIRDPITRHVIGRTKWVPRSEWWMDRPGKPQMSEKEVRRLVDLALRGRTKALGPKQRETLNWMLDRIVAQLPTKEEYEAARAQHETITDEPADKEAAAEREAIRSEAFAPPSKPIEGVPFAVAEVGEGTGFDLEEEGRLGFLYRAFVNDLEPLVRAEKQAVVKLQAPAGETLETALSRMPGRVYAEGEKLRAQFVEPLKAKLREAGISREEADDALLDLSAPKANETLAKRHPRKFGNELNPGSGIRTSEAQARTAKRLAGPQAQAYRWLQDWNRRLNKLRLDTLEQGQLISPEQRQGWVDAWGEDYVPYRTLEDAEGTFFGGGPGLGVSGPEAKRREGRSSKADSPLAFSLHTALRAMDRVERNRVGNLSAELVRRNPGAFWGVVEDRGKAPEKADLLSFKEGGEQRWIWTTNKPLGEAFQRLGADPGFIKGVDPVLGYIRKTITQWDPTFPLRNMPKDMGVATIRHAIHGDFAASAATLKGAIPAARGALQAIRQEGAGGIWGDWFRRARDAGALIGWNESFDPAERIKELDRATTEQGRIRKLASFFSDLNKSTELGTRIAGFRALVEAGTPEPLAAMKTRRITVDFARRGKWAPVYNRLFLFSGANIQGTAEMLSSIAKNPARAATVLGTYAGIGFMNYALSLMLGDDDELKKLSENDKARFFGVLIGKRRIGVMAPYGFNIFPYMGWKLGEVMLGGADKSEATANVAAQAFDALNPLPQAASVTMALTPTLLRPFEEIAENKDFAGRPIAPPEEPFARVQPPAHLRKFKSVPPTYDAITRALSSVGIEFSPEHVQHLARAASGGVGTAADRFTDSMRRVVTGETDDRFFTDFPFTRPFVQQPARGAEMRIYYENLTRVAEEAQKKKLGEGYDADVLRLERRSKFVEKRIGILKKRLEAVETDQQKAAIQKLIDAAMADLNRAFEGAK